MGSLRVLSGKQVCEILVCEGFVPTRQRGSHMMMQRALLDTTITVPVPLHGELARGALAGIIRMSQIDRAKFETD